VAHSDDQEAGPPGGPDVPVPVSAEDFAKRRRRMRLAAAGVTLLMASIAAYAYKKSTDPMRARESYDAGERLYRVARYTQAIISLDAAIGYKSDYAEAYLLRGRARLAMNDAEGALPDLTRTIQLRPGEPQAYLARGSAYLELKNPAEALADCAKAIQLNPRMSAAYNLRGSIVRTLGKPAEALADFTRALELDESLDNYLQRGAAYQTLGQHALAIADFDRAIEFFPFSPQAYFARANSKRALGDKAGAQADHDYGRSLDDK
jgi:tetratricopeptide (TPR) repeat protein